MNCASARCRCARPPRKKEKRAPESFAAVAKSRRPSASPMSVWSLIGKSNALGAPQRRISTLSSGEAPTGVEAWLRFGRSRRNSRSSRCTRSSSASRRFVVSPIPATSVNSAAASSPLPFAMPICLDNALRRAWSSCVRTWMSLRSRSSASKRSASSVTPRLAKPAATSARSLRKRLMSSIGQFYQTGWARFRTLAWKRDAHSPRRPDLRFLVPRLAVLRAKSLELFADLRLEPAIGGLVPCHIGHAVGKIALSGGVGTLLVMRVAIALAVIQLFHELRRRIAQPQRHRPRAVFGNESACLAIRRVDGIRFRRAGEIKHGLGQRELTLGRAETLVGFHCRECQRQRARIGESDVF